MITITDAAIEETLRDYGVSATPSLCLGIRKYISLLLRWNEKISLTAITDSQEILRRHFGETMIAASVVPIRNGRLADVGSGAGFPGLPLKLLIPSLDLVLIESNGKKASFLLECIRGLDLHDAQVYRSRFESIDSTSPRFDFITARALGSYSKLVEWSRMRLVGGGTLVLWLGDHDAAEIRKEGSFNWRPVVPIKGSQRRVLLIGTKGQ